MHVGPSTWHRPFVTALVDGGAKDEDYYVNSAIVLAEYDNNMQIQNSSQYED